MIVQTLLDLGDLSLAPDEAGERQRQVVVRPAQGFVPSHFSSG